MAFRAFIFLRWDRADLPKHYCQISQVHFRHRFGFDYTTQSKDHSQPAQIPVSGLDTTGRLTVKLSRLGAQLLLEVLPRWLQGELSPRPQDGALASYCRPIAKGAGEIDWELTAASIWRQIRAYSPWPGSYTRWQGKRIKIIEAVLLPGEGGARVGQVVALSGEGEAAFGVATGEGVLGILKLQLAGKRVVGATEFLQGQRDFIGAQLGLSRGKK